jgi:uncharacterized membrane protein
MNFYRILNIIKLNKYPLILLVTILIPFNIVVYFKLVILGYITTVFSIFIISLSIYLVYYTDKKEEEIQQKVNKLLNDIKYRFERDNKVIVYVSERLYKILLNFALNSNIKIKYDKTLKDLEYTFTKKSEIIKSINDL